MGRRPLATVVDHFGDAWDVVEVRDTAHPFPVLFGYPADHRPGMGPRGGKRVILTPEIARHLEAHRRETFEAMRLPIGKGAIQRLRKLLGHHRVLDSQAWWEERFGDLCELTLEEFAAKHGAKVGAVEHARLTLVGRINRENGWWREEPVRAALTSDRPAAAIAEELGIPAGSVGRLRTLLKREGHAVPTDYRERISRAKRGRPAHPRTREALLRAVKRKKPKAHRRAIGSALRSYWDSLPRPHPPVDPDDRPWTAREERMLGKALDRVVAAILGRSVAAVRSRRRGLGIPASRHARLHQSPRPRTDRG